jgi:Sigma-70 region 2
VSIVRDDPSRGVQTTEAAHYAAHDRIAVLLAGEAAQYLRDEQRTRQPDPTDRRAAEDPAAMLPPDAESVLDAEWRRVLEMLQNPATWQPVETVTEMLLRRKTLDGEAIRRVSGRRSRVSLARNAHDRRLMLDESDRGLVLAAAAGDHAAFGQLVARYRPALLRLCVRLTGEPALAEDCVQDACLLPFLRLPRLRSPESFGAWLNGIGRHTCQHAARARRAEFAAPTPAPDAADQRTTRLVALWLARN